MLAAVGQPYDLAMKQLEQRVAGARAQVPAQNALLNKSIAQENQMSNASISQRQQAIQQILAEEAAQRAAYDRMARTDLNAQGIQPGGYNLAAGVEGQRLASEGSAQKLVGADLDALARQAAAARVSYAGQSQQDVLSNIGASQQSLAAQIALQRAQDEAKIRAQAASAGVKI